MKLFGKTREAVLALLILRSDERFHLRQVARLSGASLGAVQRELAALVVMGVISREQSGNQVCFQARADCPFFVELKRLLSKTSGAIGVIRSMLDPLRGEIAVALIFGSGATDRMNSQSDVDLLIISERLTMRELGGKIRQVASRLGRDLNINLYRPGEWSGRVKERHPFARSIREKPRVFLIGDEHELDRLAEKRLAQTPSSKRKRDRKTARSDRKRPARQR